jgi:hypothetical protein
MKQSVKVLDRSGPCYRQLIRYSTFTNSVNDFELQAWDSLKDVIITFLGNFKDPQYEETVKTVLEKLQALRCNRSLNLNFLHSHLGYFPQNLGALNEEHRERIHPER